MYRRVIFETEAQLDLFTRRVSRRNKSRVRDLTLALPYIRWEPEYLDGLESLVNVNTLTLNQPSLFLKFAVQTPRIRQLHLNLHRLSFFQTCRDMPVDEHVTHLSVRLGEWNAACFHIFMNCFPNLRAFRFEIEDRRLPSPMPDFESCLTPMIQSRVISTVTVVRSGSVRLIRL